jgi:Ca2+-binding EF-hand superfamily protein
MVSFQSKLHVAATLLLVTTLLPSEQPTLRRSEMPFGLLDRDGTGFVTDDEFPRALSKPLDKDGDGKVSQLEYERTFFDSSDSSGVVLMVLKWVSPMLFKRLDSDKSGFLSTTELGPAIAAKLDKDGDDQVSPQEFSGFSPDYTMLQ